MVSASTIAATSPRHIEPAKSAGGLLHQARVAGAAIFIIALFLPMVGAGLKWDPAASSENRALAKLPPIPKNYSQVKMYAELFMGFYRDHFGFRNTLIRGLALGRFHGGLGMDLSTNIIIGKDGWLFFPSSIHDGFLAERNLDPFSPAELDQWQQLLEKRNKFFTERGYPFILVIAPDKQSIYTDMMPEQFSRVGPKTRLDQLIERLRETHSPVRLIDLRPVLLEARKTQRIYFKTDTHWNDTWIYITNTTRIGWSFSDVPLFRASLRRIILTRWSSRMAPIRRPRRSSCITIRSRITLGNSSGRISAPRPGNGRTRWMGNWF
jgi:hypothetical protein